MLWQYLLIINKLKEAGMHRFITFGCMLLATILWIAGQAENSIALFAAAGLFELVFWKRVLSRRSC